MGFPGRCNSAAVHRKIRVPYYVPILRAFVLAISVSLNGSYETAKPGQVGNEKSLWQSLVSPQSRGLIKPVNRSKRIENREPPEGSFTQTFSIGLTSISLFWLRTY